MKLMLPLAAAAILALGGCATLPPGLAGGYSTSADAYTVGQARRAQTVRFGTVVAVRRVTLAADAGTKAGGSAIGAVLGGLLGHQVGGGNGKKAATIVGGIAGAIGGNLAAGHLYAQSGMAITVKLDDGPAIEVAQASDVAIQPGARVAVVGSGYASDPARVLPIHAAPDAVMRSDR
jgi:outer membrane lipoprotein SlyB